MRVWTGEDAQDSELTFDEFCVLLARVCELKTAQQAQAELFAFRLQRWLHSTLLPVFREVKALKKRGRTVS